MSVTTVSSSMITDATILNADIGAAAAIATTKLGAGAIVQVVNVQTGAMATGTTVIPFDDTIPQITEGNEYMTLAITPTNSSNKLIIQVVYHYASTTASHQSAALFQDTTAGAIASAGTFESQVGGMNNVSFTHYMTSGTTSATTFKVRAGQANSNTTTFNGNGGARSHGGALASSITITEIKV
tara:strand:- start:254 stop:805 length:552 start_codon:yes stop_codon:yes gene_type:complete